jgi:TfoX/Sxy family transcriptional regulator of competence genes
MTMPKQDTTTRDARGMTPPARKYREDVLSAVSGLLDGRPDVVPRAMFGHPGFATGGKMFACLYDDGLGLKLPEEQANAAIQRPGVEPFRPYGKLMREWVMIAHDDLTAFAGDLDLFEASIEHVARQASAPRSPRGGRRRATG